MRSGRDGMPGATFTTGLHAGVPCEHVAVSLQLIREVAMKRIEMIYRLLLRRRGVAVEKSLYQYAYGRCVKEE